MNFDELIDFKFKDEKYRGQVPEEWCQGRTAYGGVTVAAAIRALRYEVPKERPLLQFNAQFASVASGQLELSCSVLAQGSNVSTGQVTAVADGRVCLLVTAVFGAPRFSSKSVEAPELARVAPETLAEFPYVEGLTPQFTRHIEYRMSETHLPFCGNEPRVEGYCRHKASCGSAEEATIGLLDSWPPVVLPMLDRPCPASTITWSAHLYQPPEHQIGEWWHYSAEPIRFQDGYASTQARLYAPDGRLAAWSEQLVAVFEKARV